MRNCSSVATGKPALRLLWMSVCLFPDNYLSGGLVRRGFCLLVLASWSVVFPLWFVSWSDSRFVVVKGCWFIFCLFSCCCGCFCLEEVFLLLKLIVSLIKGFTERSSDIMLSERLRWFVGCILNEFGQMRGGKYIWGWWFDGYICVF